ncbi:hypothetical protein AgCh_032700 [Apium graveolens]
MEFEEGSLVLLKVSPWKGLTRFGKKGKLSPRYVGPFEILKRVGKVAYELALPPHMEHIHNIFHVSMLKKYNPDSRHVIEYEPIELQEDLSYVESLIEILEKREKVLRNKVTVSGGVGGVRTLGSSSPARQNFSGDPLVKLQFSTLSFGEETVRSLSMNVKEPDRRNFCQLLQMGQANAGKEILVKTVGQFMPTYTMNVILIPLKVIYDLERMFSKFWWGSKSNGNKRIHWLSWPRMCSFIWKSVWEAKVVTVVGSRWKNQKHTQVSDVVNSAIQYLVQWTNAQSWSLKALFQSVNKGDGAEKWVVPHVDTINVNVDASTFEDQDAFGFGILARNHKGEVEYAKTLRFRGLVSAVVAEIMAIKEALSWIKEGSWQKVGLESDCLVTVQALRSKIEMISPFGRVVMPCRGLLRDLNTMSVFFVKLSANMAVHHLATVSYLYPDRVFHGGDVPIEVKNVLLSDLSS